MKDHLLDLVEHTHGLGCIDAIKVTGTAEDTIVNGIEEKDKRVVINAKFVEPIPEFNGTFGMPNLSNLKTLLHLPVYDDNAKISIKYNNDESPSGLHFENDSSDFTNDYRFMSKSVVDKKLKTPKFKGVVAWDVECKPSKEGIQRMKYQAQANAGATSFRCATVDGDLVFYIGNHSTHAGSFVFQSDIEGCLAQERYWPIKHVLRILDMDGFKTIRISDAGAMMITVDSGLAVYDYILPARNHA